MSDKIEKWIDEALRTEPSYKVRGDFRDKVVKAIRRKEQKDQRSIYFWMTFGLLVFCAAGYVSLTYFFPTMFQGFGQLRQITPIAILIGVLIVTVQYLDKKLVKDRLIGHGMR
ncbi:MAG: hypothetical protein Tsb0034_22750 [Ekhidna sp.]